MIQRLNIPNFIEISPDMPITDMQRQLLNRNYTHIKKTCPLSNNWQDYENLHSYEFYSW